MRGAGGGERARGEPCRGAARGGARNGARGIALEVVAQKAAGHDGWLSEILLGCGLVGAWEGGRERAF